MQVLELPAAQHPFFVGAQFHPELTSRPLNPNPLFMGLVAAAIRAKVEAAGLQTGLHMLSSWATTCYGLDAWVPPCPDSVTGWARAERCPNHCAKSRISDEHPELFVPQGPAPHNYFWPNTAGTWYCHLQPARNFYGPDSPAHFGAAEAP